MAFRIKNITKFAVTVHNVFLQSKETVDLSDHLSSAEIRSSLLTGELYNKIQGKMLSILSPPSDWGQIGLSQQESSRLIHAGFFLGYLSNDELKPPFTFNEDGYLNVGATITAIDPGTSFQVQGMVADGDDASTVNPVVIGGVDGAGNTQSLAVNDDGYLLTSTVVSIEINNETEGRVFDGADATGIKPVIISGVDDGGLSQSISVDSDGYVNTILPYGVSVEGDVISKGVYVADPTLAPLSDGEDGYILLTSERRTATEDRSYDATTDSNKVVPVFIPQDRYEFADLSGTQSASDATYSYYIDMQGYSFFSLQYIQGTNDGYQTLKIYASNHDVENISTATYSDVTEIWTGNSSFTESAWIERDSVVSCKYIKVEMAVTELIAGETSVWTLYFMKKLG